MYTLADMAKQRVQFVRSTKWICPFDHLELYDEVFGDPNHGPNITTFFYSPMNDGKPIKDGFALRFRRDDTSAEYVPYEGHRSTSEEYIAEAKRFKALFAGVL